MVAKNGCEWTLHRANTKHDIDGERSRQRDAIDRLHSQRIPTRSVEELEQDYRAFYDDRLTRPGHAPAPAGIRKDLLHELATRTTHMVELQRRRHHKPTTTEPPKLRGDWGKIMSMSSTGHEGIPTPARLLEAARDQSMVRGASQEYKGAVDSKVRAQEQSQPTETPLEATVTAPRVPAPAALVQEPATGSAATPWHLECVQAIHMSAGSR